MSQEFEITQREAIEQVCAEMDGPVGFEEFVERVLEIWPSQAKNPARSIRQSVNNYHQGKDLLYLDGDRLIPMRMAMRGVRFRVPLSSEEVKNGWLFTYPSFQRLHHPDLKPEDFHLQEKDGHRIPVNPVTVKYKEKTIFGTEGMEKVAFDLSWWYRKHGLKRKDSLLVTILDWEGGRYQLEPETAKERNRHRSEIEEQNQTFADIVFDFLEAETYEGILDKVAIATAYLRMKDRQAYPADHWLDILENDPRMGWTGFDIRYSDWQSPFESLFEIASSQPPPKLLSEAQARQVYRFKAYFSFQKSIWRRIEIQGGQTLKDLDDVLRDAFLHDYSDHLSGFWKMVRRGDTRRFREIDLGYINPFEGGEAAEVRIADLEMEPGEMMKYVYDFGDWIEHRVQLEAIDDPEPDAEYPRVTAQNKPRYRYCDECKKEGKQTVATWFCYDCSNNEEGRDVLLCEEHFEDHDEEHYLEEVVY